MPSTIFQVQVGASVPLFSQMTLTKSQETEILPGEQYELVGNAQSFVKVKTLLDNYEGYVYRPHHTTLASSEAFTPTHCVDIAMANVYKDSTFKSVVAYQLPFNASVSVLGIASTTEGEMARIGENEWVFLDALRGAQELKTDFVEECLKLAGQPYTWGGRNGGWDCSSAIQAGCIPTNIPCERDVGPQSRTLGMEAKLEYVLAKPCRGDLIFWTEGKGRHAVVMVDTYHAFHFSIAGSRNGRVEKLYDIINEQQRDGNGNPTIARRITDYKYRHGR